MSAELLQRPELQNDPKLESLRDQLATEHIHHSTAYIEGNGFTAYDPGDIGLPRSGYFAVVGEIRLEGTGKADAAIVRDRREGQESFLVLGLSKDQNGNVQYNGHSARLQQGNELVLGRDEESTYLWDHKDEHVSRKHLKISLTGNAIFVQDTSSNGTTVAKERMREVPSQVVEQDSDHRHEYTSRASDLLALMSNAEIQEFEGETYVDGRVTVGRDTIINHERPAIDIRSWRVDGESIVIDSKRYPEAFNKLKASYEETLKEITRGKRRLNTEEAKLKAVFETVSKAMDYDLEYVKKVEAVIQKRSKADMRKVSLSNYLEEGKGVCRHMALAVAWLGGELARTGELDGATTTGANVRSKDNSGHEWARYTSADGTVYIIDPAQKHFGKLEDSISDKSVWEYFRPGERQKYEALNGKGNIDPANIVFGAGRIVPRIWH